MGNICEFKLQEPIETSFSDHIPKPIQRQPLENNFPTERQQQKHQQNQTEFPSLKSKVSSRILSAYQMSKISQAKSMKGAVIVPPSQCDYDKFQNLELLSQVPSQFFNQCNMSNLIKSANSKINQGPQTHSFIKNKTQSKISKISKPDDSPKINFYFKSNNDENHNIEELFNQRNSKSELKLTTSTKISDEKIMTPSKSAIQMTKNPKQTTLNLRKNIVHKDSF